MSSWCRRGVFVIFAVSMLTFDICMPDPNINFASFVLSLAATAAVHFGDRLEPGQTEPGRSICRPPAR